MRVLLTAVLGLGLIVCATAAGQDDKKDKEKLQGTWSLVSGEKGGKPAPDEVKKMKMTFDGDKIIVALGDNDRKKEGTFTLDTSKKPKEITLKPKAEEGKPLEGIYDLDGDTLKLCFSDEGEAARPKEFGSKEGSKSFYMVLKRDKKK